MKIAVLSDIHGNFPALIVAAEQIEQWKPDVTVVNGDVVNRGPRSVACWDFVQERREAHDWHVVGGNHEAYVASWAGEAYERHGPRFEIDRSSYWTYCRLGERVPQLLNLPSSLELTAPDGSTVRITHGSMRGLRDGIYEQTPLSELRQQIAPAPDIFCTAHTHKPLTRSLNGTLVINSGSAGTSFDGDPRISYAQLTWLDGQWDAEIVRLTYDRAQAARDFEASGYLQGGGPLVEIFYQEWHKAQPMVNQWARRFQDRVLAGEMTLSSSVRTFLQESG